MPRYLVVSDIHANLTAFEAVLAAAEGRWERAVCLGDVVGYGPDPNETIERVVALSMMTIRGNHDKTGAGLEDSESFNPVARAAVDWTHQRLTAENLRWLSELPAGPLVRDGLVFVHGALDDEDEYVFSAEMAARGLEASPSPVTLFGHTHIQGGFLSRNDQVETIRPPLQPGAGFVPLALEDGVRYLLNPGSVGQPRDGDPRAAFGIVDTGRRVFEFWRVPYNVAAVQKRMERAGLPEPLVLRLAFGR